MSITTSYQTNKSILVQYNDFDIGICFIKIYPMYNNILVITIYSDENLTNVIEINEKFVLYQKYNGMIDSSPVKHSQNSWFIINQPFIKYTLNACYNTDMYETIFVISYSVYLNLVKGANSKFLNINVID